ncbi:MAG: HlyC/CorC family transporter [Rhodospirillaceae bacterium]|nr:HlyC/CorC family transporter [Rhodospirillaceae bacterium]
MADTHSDSRGPRAQGGADLSSSSSLGGLFRGWLRSALGSKPENNWRETIEELIEEREDDGGRPDEPIAVHERQLIANVLNLRETTAADLMVPRADIVAVDIGTPLSELRTLLSKRAHSRLPVYRETLDDVVGFVHIKDIVAKADAADADVHLCDMVRDVLIVAPSMPALDLLLEMRQSRQHLALVVDEFGGIDGLITIEDVVEVIVGEIKDEHDIDATPHIEAMPDGSWVADARVPVEEFEETVGPILDDEEREDIDTLGGLVFTHAGRVPVRGELITLPAGLELEVIDSDPRRVKSLRIRRVEPHAPPHAAAGER